ncbi:transposase [Moorena sp. SIO4G3]|uniref:RNA-guided endonuclease InsQ/TnpB family protein n=1 Tax=Moorena sp. SIO4G3 TaxID=2607821 RepID=UPI001429844A|nr:transposase [Moorena sp. SIO4G3]NEO79294.1 transposase [Moorena sp. SIO4G3]
MFPSKELHKVWKTWLNAYRWIYNWSIATIKNGYQGSTYDLQKLARNADRPEWVKTLPGHQLQEAVADAIDAAKQALASGGKAKFKSCRQTSQVIKFKAGDFKKGFWYPTKVKGLSFRSPQGFPDECIYGTQLLWIKGKWYGIFPEYIEPTPTFQDRVIALDPGIRTFLTGFDGSNYIEIGKSDIGRIQRLCQQLDRLMSRIDLSSAKRQRRSRSVRQSAAMRKAAHRLRQKIQDLIKDTRNKSASFLVSNYKLIFLPTFETSEMVVKSARKLNKKTARNLLTWSHYKFRQHLIQMADRNDVKVVLVNESYTSKTCPECGHIHEKLGGNKKFQCPKCSFSLPRDWNGARNIMIRALSATTTRFLPGAIQVIPADK